MKSKEVIKEREVMSDKNGRRGEAMRRRATMGE